MTIKPDHRRGEGRKQDHGSAWEGEPNDGGEGIRKRARQVAAAARAASGGRTKRALSFWQSTQLGPRIEAGSQAQRRHRAY